MDILANLNFIAVGIILLFIGIQDVRFRLIDNRHLVGLCILIVTMTVISGSVPNILLAMVTLAIGFLLFCANLIGAGDVKLMAVLALALQTSSFFTFLFITTFIGGLLAIGGLIFFRDITRRAGVPYGMAISFAFIFSYS